MENGETRGPLGEARERTDATPDPACRRDPEALRQQLRQLGYLANPLQRFLIGNLSRPASPLATNLVLGLKVGVLAGLLVGGLLLVGFLLAHPELASAPGDVVVVSAYALGLVVAALSTVSMVAGLLMHLAARLSRRALPVVELVATHGAVVATGAVFVYLAFWWRATRGELGMAALGWPDALAASAVLVVCVLLGSALRAGGRVLVVRVEKLAPAPVRRAPVWRLTILLGLGAVVFFLVGYVGVYGSADVGGKPVDFQTRYAGARLYLMAIDGLSYEEVQRHLEGNPGSWLGHEAPVAPLGVPEGMNAATLWTTVATGLPPALHGVESFETTRIAGLAHYVPLRSGGPGLEEALRVLLPSFGFARQAPISSVSLRARPLWDIFSQKGLRVAVVNWWATWPAEEVRGVVISDRTFAKLDFASRRGTEEPTFESETYPEDAFTVAREVLKGLEAQRPALVSGPGSQGEGLASVGFAMDRFHQELVLELLRRAGSDPWPKEYDFLCVYLPGLDIAQHELLSAADRSSSTQLEEALAQLRGQAGDLDTWLAGLAREAAGHGATVMVVGMPSRRDRGGERHTASG